MVYFNGYTPNRIVLDISCKTPFEIKRSWIAPLVFAFTLQEIQYNMATKIPGKSQNRGNEVGKIMQANLLLSQCMRSSIRYVISNNLFIRNSSKRIWWWWKKTIDSSDLESNLVQMVRRLILSLMAFFFINWRLTLTLATAKWLELLHFKQSSNLSITFASLS